MAPALLLVFESDPTFLLRFESLERQKSGIDLLSVITLADGRQRATLRVPYDKVRLMLRWIEKYRDADPHAPIPEGRKRRPNDNALLLESIANVRLATVEAFWTDSAADYPDANVPITWEVWLRRRKSAAEDDGGPDPLVTLDEAATTFGYTVVSPPLEFVDRTVVLVRATREQLSQCVDTLGFIAELRRAKDLVEFFIGEEQTDQHQWIASLLDRVTGPPADAPVVGLLDTGLNHGHPLIAPAVNPATDLHAYAPGWGTHDGTPFHGTPMAGLVLYGDLAAKLASDEPLQLTHGLQSVKLINANAPHEPRLYGVVTHESITRLDVVPRRRIYCMAITADGKDRGRPSSWSSAVDALAAGADDGLQRLILVSAGNLDPNDWANYPDANEVASIHDPAQAWNALAVGGTTERAAINPALLPNWQPLALPGDLAPSSSTSITWSATPSKPPFKPDIVMEAGNRARHRQSGDVRDLPELQLLSTNHRFAAGAAPFSVMRETSAATALAANLVAELAARYPNFTPETLRGMMLHAARWSPAMLTRCRVPPDRIDLERLLRTFGYGAPNRTELFASADKHLTLISQDAVQPFYLAEDGTIKSNHLKLHELPWPTDALRQLPAGTDVTLRITLSYFIEPSPGERGWDRKYGYPSHGLRFQLKRSLESVPEFRQRINKYEQDEEYQADAPGETGRWFFGARPTSRGSIHANIWIGDAYDLASRTHIAVHPVIGWWRTRKSENRYDRTTRYSLIVSITTPPETVDIYTPIANLIGIPNPIEIEV